MAHSSLPWGYQWRSKRLFVIVTVGIGMFSDLFLYGIVVPIMPFLLRDRLGIPDADIQTQTSRQLAAYAGSSVLFAVPVGWAADKIGSRKTPFLVGITTLLASTAMLCTGRTIAALLTARLLQGLSVAIVWAVGLATIQDLVGTSELGRVTGSIFSFVSVGELIAPTLGGFLYHHGGMNGVFAACGVVLLVDLSMRLLMLDKMEMDNYESGRDRDETESNSSDSTINPDALRDSTGETSPLLDVMEDRAYQLPQNTGWVARHLPIVFCMRNSQLAFSMILALVQGMILGAIDATVPIELTNLFSFTPNRVGLVFLCILAPFVGLGHPAGWAADTYGTRVMATAGYLLMIPAVGLLALPSLDILSHAAKLPVFCIVMALNGIALAITAPISFVEAGSIVEAYQRANPGFFGKHGPYAQLYGFNSLFFFAGLAIGPLSGGWISEAYGFPVMAGVFASIAAIVLGAVLMVIKRPVS